MTNATQTARTMTAREMALTSHNLGRTGDTATTADGRAWRWSDAAEMWVRQAKTTRIDALLTAENARDWKTFVADYVAHMTARKENRELVGGYQVKKVKGGYQILFGGMNPGYGVMTAERAYEWFCRLPLNYLARQADNLRIDLLAA
jgi:hypothetical protein